jgi:hypothetical protein
MQVRQLTCSNNGDECRTMDRLVYETESGLVEDHRAKSVLQPVFLGAQSS